MTRRASFNSLALCIASSVYVTPALVFAAPPPGTVDVPVDVAFLPWFQRGTQGSTGR